MCKVTDNKTFSANTCPPFYRNVVAHNTWLKKLSLIDGIKLNYVLPCIKLVLC